MQNPNSDAVDDWHARIRLIEDPAALQDEMDSLGASIHSDGLVNHRAVCVSPSEPKTDYLYDFDFPSRDWWHVIGNMWFLWLAGFVLEDAWGRPLYLLIYLAAGQSHASLMHGQAPEAFHSVGASGAIAGLMGAFLVRFPKMKSG